MTAKEIRSRIDELRGKADPLAKHYEGGSDRLNLTNIRLEMLELALQLEEISTKRIVSLTRWLVALTLVLAFLTAYLSYEAYSARCSPRQAQPGSAK